MDLCKHNGDDSMTINKRVYAQYRNKPKAVEWLNIVPAMSGDISNAYQLVRNMYDIDSANGEQLNIIGRIVVIDRGFESFVVFDPDCRFGAGNKASRFGGLGARFNNRGATLSQEVSDAIFRILIRSKIANNNSDATLDGIVSALSYITSSSKIRVVDNENMTMSVSFGETLSDIERFVFNTFDIIPRPQGVMFLGYTEEPEVTRFGGGLTFGDSRSRFTNLYFGA